MRAAAASELLAAFSALLHNPGEHRGRNLHLLREVVLCGQFIDEEINRLQLESCGGLLELLRVLGLGPIHPGLLLYCPTSRAHFAFDREFLQGPFAFKKLPVS